jgi:hypothetical protein
MFPLLRSALGNNISGNCGTPACPDLFWGRGVRQSSLISPEKPFHSLAQTSREQETYFIYWRVFDRMFIHTKMRRSCFNKFIEGRAK